MLTMTNYLRYIGQIVFVLFLLSFKSDHFEYRKINNIAFSAGESIEFRIHYGFVTAGYGSIKVLPYTEKVKGREVYHIIGKGKSASSFDWFFKVRDEYHSYLDMNALAPLKYTKEQHEGGFNDNDDATFDHEKKVATSIKGMVAMPEYTQDVISMVYYARSLNVKDAAIGTSYPITFYLDKQVTKISLKIIGREIITTDLGKFKTIKIRPQVIADRVFKDQDAMTLWVSDDANLLPLRIQADLAVGSIKADIVKYSGLKNNPDALLK
ncbi:MAG: DUF3108 domain-containing protein [Bacteroidetes bacterium]|nr:DUF3108 domain-containing protein [Bacteroidota bacterium]